MSNKNAYLSRLVPQFSAAASDRATHSGIKSEKSAIHGSCLPCSMFASKDQIKVLKKILNGIAMKGPNEQRKNFQKH